MGSDHNFKVLVNFFEAPDMSKRDANFLYYQYKTLDSRIKLKFAQNGKIFNDVESSNQVSCSLIILKKSNGFICIFSDGFMFLFQGAIIGSHQGSCRMYGIEGVSCSARIFFMDSFHCLPVKT